jgi:hypothetical protein
MRVFVYVGMLVLATSAAGAESSGEAALSERGDSRRFLVAPKLGGSFPQVLSRLSTSYTVALEVGYATPLFGERLVLSAEASYTQPPHARTLEDPRVGDGTTSYTVTERIFGMYAGPKLHFALPASRFILFAGIGVRAQLIASAIEATSGGEDFGRHTETGTHLAFAGLLGVGYRMGPGHLSLDLQLVSSPIDHRVTGDVDVGALSVRVGYLLSL